MGVSEAERTEFAAMVERYFTFLKNEGGLSLVGVDSVDEGPGDSYVTIKYRNGTHRLDIAWAPVEMSLGILLRVEKVGLSRREQSIYSEPYIEFITQGRVAPLVPQIYPRMSIGSIRKAMDARARLFAGGLGGVVERLAHRFRTHYPEICDASLDTIRAYHRWYKVRESVDSVPDAPSPR